MPKVKRLSKVIHPKSRLALEIAAKEVHKNRLARSQQDTKNKHQLLARKLQWFQSAISNSEQEKEEDEKEDNQMDDSEQQQKVEVEEEEEANNDQLKNKPVYTLDEMRQLIDLYFHRFDDELDQINTKNSIGKRSLGQHFSREKSIEFTLSAEKNEYQTKGLVVPDLTNADNVKIFRSWVGDLNTLPAIKLKTVRKAA